MAVSAGQRNVRGVFANSTALSTDAAFTTMNPPMVSLISPKEV